MLVFFTQCIYKIYFTYRHPPKAEEIIENDEGRNELSIYILLPQSNVVGLPLEQMTMKITLKRVSPAAGTPNCEVQRVELRTLNFSDVRNPSWALRNEQGPSNKFCDLDPKMQSTALVLSLHSNSVSSRFDFLRLRCKTTGKLL